MVNNLEINEFLKRFNYNSYNINQIGYEKSTILYIYEYLKKLDLSEELITTIINNIAYYKYSELNIPLYLELLSRTLCFINTYDLSDVVKIVKEIHDIYYENAREIPLEEYIHDTEESRLKKVFLDRNNKYLIKVFADNQYVNELKFAAALILDKKDYKEFLSYIDEFKSNKDHYSPLVIFKKYLEIRNSLKGITKLFWDIYYGNEYVVAFTKNNLKISTIYKNDSPVINESKEEKGEFIQLDLFTYQDYEDNQIKLPENLKVFQISSLYAKDQLPEVDTEKELLAYYNNFLNSHEIINLPKLKTQPNPNYVFEIN